MLKEGVCYCLRLFYELVHELVRAVWLGVSSVAWARTDSCWAKQPTSPTLCSAPAERPGRLPADLVEYQSGRCFYCLRPLRDKADVDHFIP